MRTNEEIFGNFILIFALLATLLVTYHHYTTKILKLTPDYENSMPIYRLSKTSHVTVEQAQTRTMFDPKSLYER